MHTAWLRDSGKQIGTDREVGLVEIKEFHLASDQSGSDILSSGRQNCLLVVDALPGHPAKYRYGGTIGIFQVSSDARANAALKENSLL